MPKIKTRKSAAKRFKKTAGSVIKRNKGCSSHKLAKKSSKRKRRINSPDRISSVDLGRVKRMLAGKK